MANSESDYNAWLDGSMSEQERRRFEDSLPGAERGDAARWDAIRAALREPGNVPPLQNPDFVNARVWEQIGREEKSVRPNPLRPILAWGLASIVAAALVTFVFLPNEIRPRSEQEFISQVIDSRAGDSRMSVTSFPAPDRKGVVIWIEGTTYIPPNEQLR